jgi:hypothetical protein
VFPFTLRNYFRHLSDGEGDSTNVVSSVIVTSTSSPTTAGFGFWRAARGFIGPKWEESPATRSVTSVKGKKPVTTSVKKGGTKTEKVTAVKTVTKSVTQTVQQTIQVVETSDVEDDRSGVIAEINTMGWHQVWLLIRLFRKHLLLPRKVEDVISSPYLLWCDLFQDEVVRNLPEIKTFKVGLLHLFIQHTSAGLTLNEYELWQSSNLEIGILMFARI